MTPISLASARKSGPQVRARMTSGHRPLLHCGPPLQLLLLLLLGGHPLSQGAEAFIKVTRFQVPQRVRLGERVHLACHYELGGETLHAMKLYKDDNEFYRFTPGSRAANGEEGGQRLAFGLPGVQVELQHSNEREVWLRPAIKSTGGTYKCQVIVENTFKSLSVERQLEVRNRSLGPVAAPAAPASAPEWPGPGQHPRPRHAVHQHQGQPRQRQSAQENLAGAELASASSAADRPHLRAVPLLLLLLPLPLPLLLLAQLHSRQH